MRTTVAPGTFSSAAALTLAAASRGERFTLRPRWRVCDEPVPELLEDVLLPAAPAMAAPPRPSAPRATAVAADLRMLRIVCFLLIGLAAPRLSARPANQP